MNIIFFGAPGVGKGTQAALLAERLNVPHISTGQIFRDALEARTPLGLKAREFMDQGQLVPDEVTTAIALEALDAPGCARGFILDGYPRNRAQAEALHAAMKERSRQIDRVLYLTAPREELIERMLKRGRTDDTREVIEARLEIYHNQTAPVLDFYNETDHVAELDGVGEIDEVHERIMQALRTEEV